MLSTLTLGVGCTVQTQAAERKESIAETTAAISVGNDRLLNGGGANGGGANGGGANGGGANGGGANGGGANGGGANGGGANGGGANGGGANGGGANGGPLDPNDDITHGAFSLKTISSLTFAGEQGNGWSLKNRFINTLTHHTDLHDHGHHNGNDDGDDDGVESNSDSDTLLGASVTGKLTNGSTISLRFDEEEDFTSVTGDALKRYVVSFTYPGRDGKAYVCGVHNGVPIKAVPITGAWNFAEGVPGGGAKNDNPNLITFACQGYALYKCVDYGYPPWKEVNGVNLDDYHQACVRMIRADYCGDGTPWTVDGTFINLYDNLGIQRDTENWLFEAEWDPNGARCLTRQRIQGMATHPECVFERSPDVCGNPPEWGPTLLVSEAQ